MQYSKCSALPAHGFEVSLCGDRNSSPPPAQKAKVFSKRSSYHLFGKIAFLLLIGFSVTSNSNLAAQTTQTTGQESMPVRGTVTVDGAVQPALIRDEVAYMHFFRIFTAFSGAPSEQWDLERRKSYLSYFFARNCGPNGRDDRYLDDLQRQKLLDHLVSVAKRISANEAKAAEEITAAMRDLESMLGVEIAQKVRLHVVEHVKTKIKQTSTNVPFSSK